MVSWAEFWEHVTVANALSMALFLLIIQITYRLLFALYYSLEISVSRLIVEWIYGTKDGTDDKN